MRCSSLLKIALCLTAAHASACKGHAPSVAQTGDAAASSAAAASSGPQVTAVEPPRDAGPLAMGIPVAQATIDEAVNPDHLPVYDGPTGTVEGVVHMRGDEASKAELAIPFECAAANHTYERVFREGPGRTVADAMVVVTGYQGYLPPARDDVPVAIRDCAYDRRTIALMFGQHLSIGNNDARLGFVPTLLGANLPAELVALPHGDPVRLYPTQVGHYGLADGMKRTWMYADVFVLRYRTHAVTGLDGKFRITGVPIGKVKVSAYLPAIDVSVHPDVGVANPTGEKELELKDGATAMVDLAIDYKRPKAKPKPAPKLSQPYVH